MFDRIRLVQGDVKSLFVEAIVNATGNPLSDVNGGVSSALHAAAGPGLAQECSQFQWCEPGDAVITGAYSLPAKCVVHTVGPQWDGGNSSEDSTLASCYRNCLDKAANAGCVSIAFPAISCGNKRFPRLRAARIAIDEVGIFLTGNKSMSVKFWCYDMPTYQCYNEELAFRKIAKIRPPISISAYPSLLGVEVIKADITTLHVDAVVNAANSSLGLGAGVNGAIHRAAGPSLMTECFALGGCPVGHARLTNGYNLPARYVIHAVGPIWRGGTHGEDRLLASCYKQSLQLAVGRECRSIAFPAISCGIYRYPIARAVQIAFDEVVNFMTLTKSLMRIKLCCFDSETYAHYCNEFKKRISM